MLVLIDADIKRTVDAAVRGCFANAGQAYVSIERIYVDRIFERFVTEFGRKVRDLELSSSMKFTSAIGSLSSQDQLNRVREHVDEIDNTGFRQSRGGTLRNNRRRNRADLSKQLLINIFGETVVLYCIRC
jgi:succinate-semialdehyde dehydrogenase/glutarate-semialdehyde dehydrogenase